MQLIVKIVESEVDFRVLHRNYFLDESRYAAYLQDTGTWAIFSENFSSIRSVPYLALHLTNKTKKNMKQTCLPI